MKFKVHRKENIYFFIMLTISAILYGAFFFFADLKNPHILSYGALFIGSLLFQIIGSLFFVGFVRGNGIKISNRQFPEVYKILVSYSQNLGLKKVPELYILQGNGVLNAFAMKFFSRNYIVLYSNTLEVAYHEGMDAVSFIIGHELGHIKRGHTGFLRSTFIFPARLIPFLGNAYSRACEYTCDNIGYSLCPKGGIKGMLVLSTGKELHKKVNVDSLILHDNKVDLLANITETFLTHPQLVKRITALNKFDKEDLAKNPPHVSPSVDIKHQEVQQ